MDQLASLVILVGAVFALIAGIGQVRFADLYVRMHTATKPATLGLSLVLLGALLRADDLAPATKLALAIALQLVTAPMAAHLVGRAAHQNGERSDLVVDDLARDHPNSPPGASG